MNQGLLEIIFDIVACGIYIVDGKGVTMRGNKPFEEMPGFTNAEMTGRSIYDLVGLDNYFSGSASLSVAEKKLPVTATCSTRTGANCWLKVDRCSMVEAQYTTYNDALWHAPAGGCQETQRPAPAQADSRTLIRPSAMAGN